MGKENLQPENFTITTQSSNKSDTSIDNTKVLTDKTNNITSTPIQEVAAVTNHEILRETARRDLEKYTEKMVNQMNKGKKGQIIMRLGIW
jgi:hypothetical protein